MLEKSPIELMIIVVHIYTSIYYVQCNYNFIGYVAQIDQNTFDTQTDSKLLYEYCLTYT